MTYEKNELAVAKLESRPLFVFVFVFSIFVNLLILTGPLYMLQIYDRVIASRSKETLVALTIVMAFLFLMMGVLDYARGRIMARIGASFQERLDRRVFSAAMRGVANNPSDTASLAAQRDLEAIQHFLSSPVFIALFDLPWTPLFIVAIFFFHLYLGFLAITGGGILVGIAMLNHLSSRESMSEANSSSVQAERLAQQIKGESEIVQSLGMSSACFRRWRIVRTQALRAAIRVSDRSGRFSVISKTFRQFLQSAMLGLGALLVLRGELSAGAMIAGSILLGRALAPIEMVVGQWAVVQRAREGWVRLGWLLSRIPKESPRTPLPRPQAALQVDQITVFPPGAKHAALKMVSFKLEPGQALGVIGPSGAGKSSLARVLTGLWRPAAGELRLNGVMLTQYDPDVLGGYIGYLSQKVTLFDGTISENIARLSTSPIAEKVIEAAKKAGAHAMIIKLPNGYDTQITASGGQLSGGQIQQIGLARAMYRNPVLLVLDEPNSNLDNLGTAALNAAIKKFKSDGHAVLIMAHRPAAIQECDLLLVLENGSCRAFGNRDKVLREVVQNQSEIVSISHPVGMT